MKKISLVIFLSSIILAFPVHAFNCQNPQTQMDINQCATNELGIETGKINATYGAVRKKATAEQKQQLKAVQLAWIKFKDLSCSFQASLVEGGSLHSAVVSACLVEMTKHRNQGLEAMLNCQEGDVGCPIPPVSD